MILGILIFLFHCYLIIFFGRLLISYLGGDSTNHFLRLIFFLTDPAVVLTRRIIKTYLPISFKGYELAQLYTLCLLLFVYMTLRLAAGLLSS